MFSVIIPCHNSASYVGDAIKSVASQECGAEIICVDDSSSDETLLYLLDQAEQVSIPYSVVASHIPGPQGPGFARNLGISVAVNDYIIFLDSDDVLAPNALAEISMIINSENPAPDLIAFNYSIATEFKDKAAANSILTHQRKDLEYLQLPELLIRSYLEMKMDGSVIFTAFRRSFITKNYLSFRRGIHEDIDYMFAAYCNAKSISVLDKDLYCKRSRPSSIVHGFSMAHIEGYLEAWFNIYELSRTMTRLTDLGDRSLTSSFVIGMRGAVGVLLSMYKSAKEDKQLPLSLIGSDPAELIAFKLRLKTEVHELLRMQNPLDFESRYDKLYSLVHKKL